MNVRSVNIRNRFSTTHRFVGVLIVLLFFIIPAFSQNTKGDRTSSPRDGRFKVTQKKDRNRPGASSKRVRTRGRSLSNSGSEYTPRRRSGGGERVGRPLRPNFNVKPPSDKQRAWKGDITGRRIRHKNHSSATPNVHKQTGKSVRKTVPNREGRQNVTSGRPVRIPSATGKIKNVYPQSGKFIHNPSSRPRDTQRAVSNRSALARLKTLETRKPPPGKKVRVVPRTASKAFIRHKSINVYANFRRPKGKGEKATTRDLAGRRLRTKNFQTPSPGLIKAPNTYSRKRRVGDRPYSGPSGSYESVSGKNRGAWLGDITHRNLRHRDRTSKKQGGGAFGLFQNNRSATRTGRAGTGGINYRSRSGEKRVGTPLPARAPGIGAMGIGNYKGNRRGIRGFANQGEQYSGALKSRRMAKGGGSVSGRRWNNNGLPIAVRLGKTNVSGFPGRRRLFENQPGFSNQGEGYSGALKSRRPLRGGGSVSGRSWNNGGAALPVRIGKSNVSGFPGKMKMSNVRGFKDQGEEYSGGMKARRPLKGGGSVSGKLWNNDGTPLPPRQPVQQRGLNFSGNLKSRRPSKGGGSVSGKLWNNNETPIPGRTPPAVAREQSGYPGKLKQFEATPGFSDQGEEFTGYIKLSRLKRNYVQNTKAHEESIKKKRPEKNTYEVNGLQVKVKRGSYVKNKNASEEALLKLEETKSSKQVTGLHIKVKRRDYVRNKNSSEDALLKLRPSKTDREVNELHVSVKEFNYKKNPSSADDALKVREPGKVFARASDYQGNIKMNRVKLFERNRNLHPDSKFVKTNKNNVEEERDTLTNLKLWWARLFRKEETQPDHLKDKGKKPRYDKGEAGMWYD